MFVQSLYSVGYYSVDSGRKWIVAVHICAVQVVKSVFPSAYIKGIAVRHKGFASQFLYVVANGFRVVGAQICKVAGLAEMQLYSDELPRKIDFFKARFLH